MVSLLTQKKAIETTLTFSTQTDISTPTTKITGILFCNQTMTTRSSTSVSAPELIAREKMSESERWRYIGNNAITSTSVGALFAGLAGLVLFRSIPARVATASLGAGVGLGRSYVDARYVMGHDIPAHRQWSAAVQPVVAEASGKA